MAKHSLKRIRKIFQIRGPFAKVVDVSYYSVSEHYGGTVKVSFSKYLPWQAMHFLQRSTHFLKTCSRPFGASFRKIMEQAVLISELPFHSWKSPEIAWGRDLNCMADVLMGIYQSR
jgi:hypothetical protein